MSAEHEKEWFNDEWFWPDLFGFIFPESRFAEVEKQVENLLALANPPGKDVLDLCSGPGRWSVPLAKRGFTVTGVDITDYLMDEARARAEAAGLEIEWVKEDMRDFVRPESFDLALNMFTSFGYFDNREDDIAVLRNVIASLKPGGAFLMELTAKERLARIFQPTTSSSSDDGSILVERHEVFDGWSRIRNEWLLIRDGQVKTYRFHHTVYSGQELRERFERVGFTDVRLYGDLGGEDYGPDARRLIVVGRKPT